MTEEEYLRGRGFKCVGSGNWQWPSTGAIFTQEGALECQLEEDRDLYNFVRERSAMEGGMLVPIPKAAPGPGHALTEWEQDGERWVRRWTRGERSGDVAVAVTYDDRTELYTGNGLAFFASPALAREDVDGTLRKQGVLR